MVRDPYAWWCGKGEAARPIPIPIGALISYPYSSKRLLYVSFAGTCKNTIGGTQWENL